MDVDIRFGERSFGRLRNAILGLVADDLIEALKDSVRFVDAVATGYMVSSFEKRIERGEGLVYNDAPYSAVVEFGCAPHKPPYEAILRWVEIKKHEYGDEAKRAAWRIVRKIEREGYIGRYYARKALEEMTSREV